MKRCSAMEDVMFLNGQKPLLELWVQDIQILSIYRGLDSPELFALTAGKEQAGKKGCGQEVVARQFISLNRHKHCKIAKLPKLIKKNAEKVTDSKEECCFFLIIM